MRRKRKNVVAICCANNLSRARVNTFVMGCASGKPASQVLPADDDSKPSKAAEPAPPAVEPATTGGGAEALPRELRLEDLFDACDDDGSGALSLDEFSQLFDDKMAKTDIAVQLKEVEARNETHTFL